MAIAVCKALADKRGKDIVALYVREKTDLCDYFIIASGSNAPQIRAMGERVEELIERELGIVPTRTEGVRDGRWAVVDYGDVIVVSVDDYSEWEGRLDSKGKQVRFLIKRLIAKAGDTVYCENGTVYLKKSWENEFTALDEPYAYYLGQASSYDFGVYELQEGEIFFLGDNRQNSQDSRYKEDGSQLGYLYK